jgi:hypothetical protein
VTAESFKARHGPPPIAGHDAVAFLQQALADGPHPKTMLVKEALQAGIATRTLYRAKQQLHIVTQRAEDGDIVWVLPSLSSSH